MGKVNKVLLMFIAMGAIMLAAVGVDRGIKRLEDQRWEAQRQARYEQAYADVASIEMTISQLARDPQALEDYLAQHREYFDDMADFIQNGQAWDGESSAEFLPGEDGADLQEGEDSPGEGSASDGMNGGFPAVADASGGAADISGNGLSGGGYWWDVGENVWKDVSGNVWSDVSGNVWSDVSGNAWGEVSGNSAESDQRQQAQVSGNEVRLPGGVWFFPDGSWTPGNGRENYPGGVWMPADQIEEFPEGGFQIVSGNGLYAPSGNATQGMAQDSVSDNEIGLTLSERRRIRGSYMETQRQNRLDRAVIAESKVDFSDLSIACLGDSITEAANLSSLENYRQYSYPARLGELLGAEKVTNLGIGGSSIGRYWDQAFVDRYREIPQDTDLILVMGGTNDGFCMNQEELGSMQERKPRTFIGDLDELLRGLSEHYPQAQTVLVTPLPNVLHDILKKERDYLLPQSVLVNAMKELAAEYGIPVIDLYNSNLLDTHDAAVIYNYMPDGVHCNAEGYTLLAEHFAAELIRMYEGQGRTQEEAEM